MDTITREKTCCFTGHRPEKLPWGRDEADPRCLRLKAMLADVLGALYGAGYRRFICGMAEGADLYFAEAVLALRAEKPDVVLEAAIPCEGQERRWPAAQRRRYARLTEECDVLTVLQPEYAPDCMLARDRYMVDSASLLTAVYDGVSRRGGTAYTMRYAAAQGVAVIQLPLSAP